MGSMSKKLLVGMSAVFIVLFSTSHFCYPRIMGNFGDIAFFNPDFESTPMNIHVVYGAGFFLNSYSDTLLLLNRVELADTQGIDYNELVGLINSAIEKMEKAREAYANLKQAADRTPYNPSMIIKLLSFEYSGFRQDKGLNPTVFKRVEFYLVRGDVRGFYGHLLSDSVDILTRLYTIKAAIDASRLPGIENLWRTNQVFSQTVLFGQYGSSIFKNILNK